VAERTADLSEKNRQLEQSVAQLKEAQAQLIQSEKMSAIGKLVAGVAHEINSPIGAIRSSTDVIQRAIDRLEARFEDKDDDLSRSMRALNDANRINHEGTERVATLVRSLLQFSRVDQSTYQVADIHEGLATAVVLLQTQIDDGVQIKQDLGRIDPIFCSQSQLNQVFMQILTNAAQAVKSQGEIGIRTYIEREYACVEVTDDGVGIPEDQLTRIFDFDFTTTGSRIKLRMGLAIANHIIHEHGGDIQIASEPGSGTHVTLRIPIRKG